jgi:hypothetical protein
MYVLRHSVKNLNTLVKQYKKNNPSSATIESNNNLNGVYPNTLKKEALKKHLGWLRRGREAVVRLGYGADRMALKHMQEGKNAEKKTRNRDDFRKIIVDYFVNLNFGENAHEIGSGSYGTTYRVPARIDAKVLEIMNKGTGVVGVASSPEERGGVLLKVQFLDNPRALKNAYEEDRVHAEISSTRGECFDGFRIAGDFVPHFIRGSTIDFPVTWKGQKVKTRLRLTLMQYIQNGKSLMELQQDEMTPLLYARIERAFTMLWIMGYSHNDAHENNIMVDASGKPYIIDFGFARKLGPNKRRSMIESIRKSNHPNMAFNKNYLNNLKVYFLGIRGNFRFTPDSGLLKKLRHDIPECKIFAARKVAWTKELRSCGSNGGPFKNAILKTRAEC